MKEIPQIVIEAAKKYKLNKMRYLKTIDDAQIFIETSGDTNEIPSPTGLPCILILKDNKIIKVIGEDALDLLGWSW